MWRCGTNGTLMYNMVHTHNHCRQYEVHIIAIRPQTKAGTPYIARPDAFQHCSAGTWCVCVSGDWGGLQLGMWSEIAQLSGPQLASWFVVI